MTSVSEYQYNVDADGWAKGGSAVTLSSRAAAREQLARDMAAYEAQHGPVVTTPIIARSITKASAKAPQKDQLTPLLQDTLAALRIGIATVEGIAAHLDQRATNIHYSLKQLRDRGLAERVARGVYQATEGKSHG